MVVVEGQDAGCPKSATSGTQDPAGSVLQLASTSVRGPDPVFGRGPGGGWPSPPAAILPPPRRGRCASLGRSHGGSDRPDGLFAVAAGALCHGHCPVTSSSREKLRKVRMSTMPASTATLCRVGVIATVRMMSAATNNSSPRRMDRPSVVAAGVDTPAIGAGRCQPGGHSRGDAADHNDRDPGRVDALPHGFHDSDEGHLLCPPHNGHRSQTQRGGCVGRSGSISGC